MPAPCSSCSTEKPWPVRSGDHPGRLRLRLDIKAATLTDAGLTSPGDPHRLDGEAVAGLGDLRLQQGPRTGSSPYKNGVKPLQSARGVEGGREVLHNHTGTGTADRGLRTVGSGLRL